MQIITKIIIHKLSSLDHSSLAPDLKLFYPYYLLKDWLKDYAMNIAK